MDNLSKLDKALREALCMHDSDNVDVYVRDDGTIDLMFCSRNNSYCIDDNVCHFDNLSEEDIDEIIKVADKYDVGCIF